MVGVLFSLKQILAVDKTFWPLVISKKHEICTPLSVVVCWATSEGLQIGKHWCWIVQKTNKIPIEVFLTSTATLLPIPEACNKAGAQECGTTHPDGTLAMLAKLAEDVNSSKSNFTIPYTSI